MSDPVRVRFAPSPTGFLHIGGVRTALYNELFARHNNGKFILRIEDTDRKRFVEGGTENICRTLKGCGIIPDEGVWLDEKGQIIERGEYGPYIQSARRDRHMAYALRLIDMDKAYYCFCDEKRLEELRQNQQIAHQPTMYDGKCRSLTRAEAEKRIAGGEKYVIRLKLPKTGKVQIHDIIRGEVEFEWALIDDQVIIKTDGFPTYHLAATCDDHDMEISHVLRAEEWISSTPKHVFIYEAFGWFVPQFAHLPQLLNPDRSKLSKRQGDVAAEDYLKKGYLPQALVNFIALLGWNPSGDREIYSHQELVEAFDLTKINKAGAVFNTEKLDWMNEHYLRAMKEEDYLALVHPFIQDKTDDHQLADRALLLVRDRVTLPSQIVDLTATFFKEELDYSKASLTWKTQTKDEAKERLAGVQELLKGVDGTAFSAHDAKLQHEKIIKDFIVAKGWTNGDTLWPLRVALSGEEKSPSPWELLEVLGKERSLKRIADAIRFLS